MDYSASLYRRAALSVPGTRIPCWCPLCQWPSDSLGASFLRTDPSFSEDGRLLRVRKAATLPVYTGTHQRIGVFTARRCLQFLPGPGEVVRNVVLPSAGILGVIWRWATAAYASPIKSEVGVEVVTDILHSDPSLPTCYYFGVTADRL